MVSLIKAVYFFIESDPLHVMTKWSMLTYVYVPLKMTHMTAALLRTDVMDEEHRRCALATWLFVTGKVTWESYIMHLYNNTGLVCRQESTITRFNNLIESISNMYAECHAPPMLGVRLEDLVYSEKNLLFLNQFVRRCIYEREITWMSYIILDYVETIIGRTDFKNLSFLKLLMSLLKSQIALTKVRFEQTDNKNSRLCFGLNNKNRLDVLERCSFQICSNCYKPCDLSIKRNKENRNPNVHKSIVYTDDLYLMKTYYCAEKMCNPIPICLFSFDGRQVKYYRFTSISNCKLQIILELVNNCVRVSSVVKSEVAPSTVLPIITDQYCDGLLSTDEDMRLYGCEICNARRRRQKHQAR